MVYLITETLQRSSWEEAWNSPHPYVMLFDTKEWEKERKKLSFVSEPELNTKEIYVSEAVVNYDSLSGTFCIPDRQDLNADDRKFAFLIRENGVIFIDDSGMVQQILNVLETNKRWRFPGLERFLYDFIDQIIDDDLRLMERFESRLAEMEQDVLKDESKQDTAQLYEIRGQIRYLIIHYEQMLDVVQEMEENENDFFAVESLVYFRQLFNRLDRLYQTAMSLREYTAQIHDLYGSQTDMKQNHIMTVLTIVTSIFMPLTLIAGWYGMNFQYMPELKMLWAYPTVIVISLLIVLISLWYFRRRKWL